MLRISVRALACLVAIQVTSPGWAQESVVDRQRSAIKNLESSKNAHLREHAWVILESVWLKPQVYVCWENPSAEFKREMSLVRQEATDTWEHESRLQFTGWEKCAPENKGIRIQIDDSGPHTIGLGRQIDAQPNGMVLNFTFANWSPSCQSTRDYCIKAIAGHEFGHAIGFAHEQNRPDIPGECREPPQGANGDKLLTPYDQNSIMNYCNVKWNNDAKLSPLDIDAVRQLYGAPIVQSGNAAPPLSIQRQQAAASQALESSTNPHLREHAYRAWGTEWVNEKVYVCWENPLPEFQREMALVQKEVADTWQHESRLQFTGWQKCAAENHGIRIQIDDSGPHTKGLGQQLDAKANGMVLNFTFKNWSPSCQSSRDYCINAIAGHEFGHAIGFAHEQNRPDAPGECRQLAQGPDGNKLLTPYDEHSIMNYCSKEWNNDGKLSQLDIQAVREIYGAPASAGR